MYGAESINDETVRAAVQGVALERNKVLEALTSQVRAMITIRLSPTPAQFHAVEDLAQQTLIALSEGLNQLRDARVTTLKSFASVVVGRKVADFLRQNNNAKPRSIDSYDGSLPDSSAFGPLREILPASTISPRSLAVRADAIRQVVAELGRLKRNYREIITFAFFDQLPVNEISERMEMTRPAASMLLVRAVKTLRRNITGSSKVYSNRERKP